MSHFLLLAIVYLAFISLGLPDSATPHALRHAAAEAIYENSGCDLFATQEFLGHSKPETTRRYVPVKRQRLRAAVMEAAKAWSDADAG